MSFVGAIKYDIYTALSPLGPWTLFNETPISNDPAGNSYTLSDLTVGTIYYIMVVAGRENEDGDLIYLSSQTLPVGASTGTNLGGSNMITIKAVRYTDIQSASLGCQVTLELA